MVGHHPCSDYTKQTLFQNNVAWHENAISQADILGSGYWGLCQESSVGSHNVITISHVGNAPSKKDTTDISKPKNKKKRTATGTFKSESDVRTNTIIANGQRMILCSGERRQTAQKQVQLTGIGEAADSRREHVQGQSIVLLIWKQSTTLSNLSQHAYKF